MDMTRSRTVDEDRQAIGKGVQAEGREGGRIDVENFSALGFLTFV